MLKNLINIKQVVSFINHVLVETKSKKYNKLVEEIFFFFESTIYYIEHNSSLCLLNVECKSIILIVRKQNVTNVVRLADLDIYRVHFTL